MSTPPAAPVSPWRWWVCGLLFLATTLNYMDRVALNQIADDIKKALSLDSIDYSRLESGFSFAFAVGAILSGIIVDRVNVRWVYPIAVLGWSVAGVMTGYATGFLWLFACRVALGLFEAANWPCGIRTTKAVLRPDERSFGNSVFQSGTAIGAVCTPGLVFAIVSWHERTGQSGEAWRLPFVLIGALGVVWVLLWFLTVPKSMLAGAGGPPPDDAARGVTPAGRYVDVFRDPRFWALLGMVVTVNITWHTYRTWFPLYLRETHLLSKGETAGVTTLFYLVADIGSWTVGLATLLLMRRYGVAGHNARLLAYVGCAGLVLVSFAVPFAPPGFALTGLVMVYAFAALGLFPTYFAMSQELSVAHQGKVTGTLGAGAHLTLSLVVYPIQGVVIQTTGSYDAVLAVAGVFPLLGFGLMLWLWPPERPGEPRA